MYRTDLAYGAMRCAVLALRTVLAYGAGRCAVSRSGLWCLVVRFRPAGPPIRCLVLAKRIAVAAYEVSGTDTAPAYAVPVLT
eukprot:2370310-Rhodomonas_salina.3